MRPVKPLPSFDELVKAVEQAGSAKADFFGFPFKADGLYLQQDPEEYAAFVSYMAKNVPPAALSLEIGTAAGGQTKFLRDYFSADKTIVVDNGEHPDFPQWKRIKPLVNTDIVLEVIADSHASATREKLLPYAAQVDVAFVDGDHSYRGLRKDIFLTKELLKPGGYMILHDTTVVRDLRLVFDELLRSPDFHLFRNFQHRFGISVWKMLRVKRKPTAFNRAFGIGRI